ncbi:MULTISPECIES: helix-turn-helix domain-containing protein [Bacillus]|uniref:Helix-turn-helix transcriptional regulator n=1 Tax=Bacillus pseudomycoides TaxID=64104 RepID=A0AAJ2DPF3_9BACI|nr:helix-turn-helix transcriptional regulator [Bacillus pseudomycoides]MCR8860695.1 helix-turn-helix domain-containing protein [Bacillus pseudomycoides]MDR4328227.1 helix-turn-helix transcriptional regulator [Bacillus pseudomycoides]MED1534509.1 helix-turn-helix transcriptional regulator [Bacillus pseudomycoides]PEJ21464.1 transcriptional regulator [Bacillus pseudomycoides]PFZ88525.1 transcriptional regulator [Bacillus pseudomycoides]
MNWFDLGKPRSKFAKFLDHHHLTQKEVSEASGLSKATISRLCKGNAFHPSFKNGKIILAALKKLTNKNVDYSDFWF